MRKYAALLLLLFTGCNTLNFKFVTSGQSVDNVTAIDRVLVGRGLLPATPSDAKIFRDAQNNALIQWRRRGRINYHWRDRAGVPVSEESEYYEIEVLSGSTVIKTMRIPLTQAQPVQWIIDNPGDGAISFATDGTGTIYKDSTTTIAPNLLSKQIIDGDFVFEFETYHNGTDLYYLPSLIMIEPANQSGLAIATILGNNSHQALVSLISGPVYSFAAAGDRFVISHLHGENKYYKNPERDNSPIWAIEGAPDVNTPYRVRIVYQNIPLSGLRNPTILRFTTPDWTYTADMQTADGLTPGDPIHLKIYMVSAQVGRGLPLDVTL